MKPVLILQLRPEDEAADGEFNALLRKSGLGAERTHRIRLDQTPDVSRLSLDNYSAVIVGGGPGCVSDDPATKDPSEARIEAAILSLMPEISERDIPYLGCCYGIGVLAHHLGAQVSKEAYGEPIGAVACQITEDGARDPLLAGLPDAFDAFVGHKEAVQNLPDAAVHLVASAPCPFQMIRYKRNVYATQFHPEADGEEFAARIRIYRHKGYFAPDEADSLTARCLSQNVHVPEQILRNFINTYS
ncbi:MAG: GMP synthase (glutamine-hydrolyzing) [Sulfitobacter sp.]|jgi:GMP synthase (glutamine-hydrolysing)